MKVEVKGTQGMKSSEFLVTIVIIVVGGVLCYFDKVTAEHFLQLAGGSGGAFALSRGIAKINSKPTTTP